MAVKKIFQMTQCILKNVENFEKKRWVDFKLQLTYKNFKVFVPKKCQK